MQSGCSLAGRQQPLGSLPRLLGLWVSAQAPQGPAQQSPAPQCFAAYSTPSVSRREDISHQIKQCSLQPACQYGMSQGQSVCKPAAAAVTMATTTDMHTLGLFGARGSSSHGLTIATLLPRSSLKKYVPPRPSTALSGSCNPTTAVQLPNKCLTPS